MREALLSTTYFGPIQWYQKLARYDRVWMEHCESYRKQTYRNRCVIATTNGLQTLTVPVVRGEGREVRISDHGNWRHLHWHALMSAYSESSFFDYYVDDIKPFFERRWKTLYDFNMEICTTMCDLLDLHPNIQPTTEYVRSEDVNAVYGDADDFREAINPKHPREDADFDTRSYYQVYQAKYGFLPNLSILDLLFNMGPEGIFYLIKKR